MYLWDTNILTHFTSEHPTLALHIQRVKWEEIVLPSPASAEFLRGRAEFALKATPDQAVMAHRLLKQSQQLIAQFGTLLFDEPDTRVLKTLLKKFKSKKRYVDLMIAAMAIAGNHVVVTRNTKHFKDVLSPHQLANWIDDPPS
ncbi:type II toxin-antitoxin system VapC family toxin [candidate division KSB1 bacterium]|nr:type II toxin-antitoxin system VapC family toxin [candidate division KSB1 bacterium]